MIPVSELLDIHPTPLTRIRQEVANFSYMVGSVFQVEELGDGAAYKITFCASSTHNSHTRRKWSGRYVGTGRTISRSRMLHPNGRVRVAELKGELLDMARSVALHEVDEWLRYKGKPLHTPHFKS